MQTSKPAPVIEVRNLWYDRNRATMPPTFTYNTWPRHERSGVAVYRNPAGSWDYVFAGAVITQRAGFTKEGAAEVIDGLLNGTDELAAGVVREHIASRRVEVVRG